MSLDDVYDMTERLDKANLDYFIVVMQTSKEKKAKRVGTTNYRASLFFNVKDDDAKKVLNEAVTAFKKELE